MQRQARWLEPAYKWLFDQVASIVRTRRGSTVPTGAAVGKEVPLSFLDVGCGPCEIMKLVTRYGSVTGVDRDQCLVDEFGNNGFEVKLADAANLPFADDSFDVVYCSFLLLWVEHPVQVIKEMARVSKHCVLILAEPDYSGVVLNPMSLNMVAAMQKEKLEDSGADALAGRKLREWCVEAGLTPELGVWGSTWDIETIRNEIDLEIRSAGLEPDEGLGADMRRAWVQACDDGSATVFYPVFYATVWL